MRYCEPEVFIESHAHSIQYLQHAITMTKDYWNGLTFPNGYMGTKYSWIDYASKQGYPTLSVDALGSRKSDRPDPLVVQMPLQVEIIHKIISMLRAGTIPSPILSGKSFSKVIFAGLLIFNRPFQTLTADSIRTFLRVHQWKCSGYRLPIRCRCLRVHWILPKLQDGSCPTYIGNCNPSRNCSARSLRVTFDPATLPRPECPGRTSDSPLHSRRRL